MSGVGVPTDESQKNLIDKVAQYVAKNGDEFATMMMKKQKGNPEYSFLQPGESASMTSSVMTHSTTYRRVIQQILRLKSKNGANCVENYHAKRSSSTSSAGFSCPISHKLEKSSSERNNRHWSKQHWSNKRNKKSMESNT